MRRSACRCPSQVLTHEQYLARYPNEDAEYVLSANENYNVDARDPAKSTFLRYANHTDSAAANMFYHVVKVRRQRKKDIKFFTARRVLPGEELCFDYGELFWRGRGVAPVVGTTLPGG